eukprot:PhF_6_TR44301/c0_g1_i2/m.68326
MSTVGHIARIRAQSASYVSTQRSSITSSHTNNIIDSSGIQEQEDIESMLHNFAIDHNGECAATAVVKKYAKSIANIFRVTKSNNNNNNNTHTHHEGELKDKIVNLESLLQDVQQRWYTAQLQVDALQREALALNGEAVIWFEVLELGDRQQQQQQPSRTCDKGIQSSMDVDLSILRDMNTKVESVTRQLQGALREKEKLKEAKEMEAKRLKDLEDELTHKSKTQECKEAELRRLRTMMQFSLLKRDSDRLQEVQQQAATMEVELAMYKAWDSTVESTIPYVGSEEFDNNNNSGSVQQQQQPQPPEDVSFSTIVDRMKAYAARKASMETMPTNQQQQQSRPQRISSAPAVRRSTYTTTTTAPTTTTMSSYANRPTSANVGGLSRVAGTMNTRISNSLLSSGVKQRPNSAKSFSTFSSSNRTKVDLSDF